MEKASSAKLNRVVPSFRKGGVRGGSIRAESPLSPQPRVTLWVSGIPNKTSPCKGKSLNFLIYPFCPILYNKVETHWMPTFRDILIFHTQSFVIAPAGHNKGSQPFLWLETNDNKHSPRAVRYATTYSPNERNKNKYSRSSWGQCEILRNGLTDTAIRRPPFRVYQTFIRHPGNQAFSAHFYTKVALFGQMGNSFKKVL